MLREIFNTHLRSLLLRGLLRPEKCAFHHDGHRNLYCASILRDLGGMAGEW
jgi:hypothetical protein